ncbi:MAG TPA: amylo-alpha-1,6-glucosidase [Vicinamibacterales bacterium]|nr:amylo-alpha-1,6-glucosidase [Vicinamibacterales bacterium]
MRIDNREWLEADGLGGFASGTVSGVRTRRYHALLLTATTPPTGRMVLVNGFEASLERNGHSTALTTQRYAPDVLHPDGASRITSFVAEPWPTWRYHVGDDVVLTQEVLAVHGTGTVVVVVWTLIGGGPVDLRVRPLLSGRDYHSTHHENGAFRFDASIGDASIAFRPYDGVPPVAMLTNGTYAQAPEWYRNFLYAAEQERGLDAIEDLASPGVLTWRLSDAGDRAIWILRAGAADAPLPRTRDEVVTIYETLAARERERRAGFASPIERAADAYLVQRGSGRTIIAGYPWFTDWGRDTFIAIRGLCLATGRLRDARDILVAWAGAVSEGMLPNRFPDAGDTPEFNAVDASLWYVVAAGELLERAGRGSSVLSASDRDALEFAVLSIVKGYAAGTRFGIRLDDDGLLAAGGPGVQLTWMDARVGDRVITPRVGKPVEVQALWFNALHVASRFNRAWLEPLARGRVAFADRFWTTRGFLADVVDVDHVPATADATLRPNQVLAVGGLPLAVVDGPRARAVVDVVESRLLTPVGLRSLAPGEPGYAKRYEGDSPARDAVYHQGTVWPWLIGPFVDAWLRTHGNTAASRAQAKQRFVEPLSEHLREAGLGHVSEIADAEPPFTPRGCPFQAWSLGELIRIERDMLAPRSRAASQPKGEPQWA